MALLELTAFWGVPFALLGSYETTYDDATGIVIAVAGLVTGVGVYGLTSWLLPNGAVWLLHVQHS